MRRYSFMMRIHPELKAEYRKAHDGIWPDMAAAIKEAGISNYSIHYRDDGTLFAYLECEDPAASFARLGKTEVNARWQAAMDHFFVKDDPSTLGPTIVALEEVFYLG